MWARQSTAATLIIGPILDSTGAEYTGAVIGDLSLSKNGGTLTATERDQPDPGIAPLVVRVDGRRARFVRITVTKLAEEAKYKHPTLAPGAFTPPGSQFPSRV